MDELRRHAGTRETRGVRYHEGLPSPFVWAVVISVLSSEDLESSAATLLQQRRNLVFIQDGDRSIPI